MSPIPSKVVEQRVLATVRNHPNLPVRELVPLVKVPRNRLLSYLHRLVADGKVCTSMNGSLLVYRAVG